MSPFLSEIKKEIEANEPRFTFVPLFYSSHSSKDGRCCSLFIFVVVLPHSSFDLEDGTLEQTHPTKEEM